MKVLLINKTSFEVIQLNSVSNIAYSEGIVTVTASGVSTVYSLEDYNLQVLW